MFVEELPLVFNALRASHYQNGDFVLSALSGIPTALVQVGSAITTVIAHGTARS
jgi:hypothetical protein